MTKCCVCNGQCCLCMLNVMLSSGLCACAPRRRPSSSHRRPSSRPPRRSRPWPHGDTSALAPRRLGAVHRAHVVVSRVTDARRRRVTASHLVAHRHLAAAIAAPWNISRYEMASLIDHTQLGLKRGSRLDRTVGARKAPSQACSTHPMCQPFRDIYPPATVVRRPSNSPVGAEYMPTRFGRQTADVSQPKIR